MSDDATGPDIQRFDRDGTWVKPPGAVRVEVTLKGGDGGTGGPGLRGGAGGGVTIAGSLGAAGGGGGAGTLTPAGAGTPGGKGETVTRSFAADDLPGLLEITVGRRGGFASVITHLEQT
jgi:hypothetical protein